MSESVLHSDRNLIITLVTHDDAIITIQSTKNGPDLSSPDDVVIVADAKPLVTQVTDRRHVSAKLGDVGASGGEFQLMIRVGEYFGGWTLELGQEA